MFKDTPGAKFIENCKSLDAVASILIVYAKK